MLTGTSTSMVTQTEYLLSRLSIVKLQLTDHYVSKAQISMARSKVASAMQAWWWCIAGGRGRLTSMQTPAVKDPYAVSTKVIRIMLGQSPRQLPQLAGTFSAVDTSPLTAVYSHTPFLCMQCVDWGSNHWSVLAYVLWLSP